MNSEADPGPALEPSASASLVARRRLLRGGLAAAPVLMSVVHRPVMAGSAGSGKAACTAASAFASLTASVVDTQYRCSGKDPSWWASQSDWPSNCKPTGKNATLFTTIFPAGNIYQGKTLLEVLNNGAGSVGQGGLARYLVAAYFNAGKSWVPDQVLNQPMTKRLWESFVTKGFYEATAGIRWDASQIVLWIRSTIQ